ncbi:holo-[acyl-carrier-protein] synthase [Candidatus Phycosocius bacilliformis]|uniref:Holo-[acyl-carrier-protein] synthase n=1 Tax=Candidatus Phycosocius bacilliformis TaxID=1445552 RepID=A0A2P2E850_9PROT|nr:holo-ACP synthase [Candidatus Phycosocius bacilliformis]GBF57249.1 holo-[acyl-carrier-protein] synthase [Candidatus Phycosocius bacilliformis]
MIIGIGSDLCRIDRIEATLARFGSRFEQRCFTVGEQARANRRPASRADTYAKRFAAKEACSKALGTGMRRGVAWRDMEVINLPTGRPTLSLSGGALKRLEELVPAGFEADIHLSLTDDHPYAMAYVVIGTRPILAH